MNWVYLARKYTLCIPFESYHCCSMLLIPVRDVTTIPLPLNFSLRNFNWRKNKIVFNNYLLCQVDKVLFNFQFVKHLLSSVSGSLCPWYLMVAKWQKLNSSASQRIYSFFNQTSRNFKDLNIKLIYRFFSFNSSKKFW